MEICQSKHLLPSHLCEIASSGTRLNGLPISGIKRAGIHAGWCVPTNGSGGVIMKAMHAWKDVYMI